MATKKIIAIILFTFVIFILPATTYSQPEPPPFPQKGPPVMGGVRPISFPLQEPGYIIYELTQPARVQIRIGIKGDVESVIRTLVDWQERPADRNREFWDLKDSAGNLIDPQNSIIKINLKPSSKTPKGKSARAKEFKGRRHNSHDGDKCKDFNIKITSPRNNATLSGLAPVTAELRGNQRGYSHESGNGMRLYLDYTPEHIKEVFFEGTDTFTYQWDTTPVPNGRHTLTVNVCDHHDHVGTDTIKINIQN